jgi:outer membrane protein
MFGSTAKWSPRAAMLAAMAISLVAASCQEYRFSNPEPYVGPVRTAPTQTVSPTPNQTPAATQTSAAEPADGIRAPLPPGPVSVTVTEAVMMALANNPALTVQKLSTPATRLNEQIAWAAFDPTVSAGLSYSRQNARGPSTPFNVSSAIAASVGYSQLFPSGTSVDVTADTGSSLSGGQFFSTGVGLTVTQQLLRGCGTEVNLVGVHKAEIATRLTEYELRAVAQTLVSDVEDAYWDYALAQRSIEIYTESLKLAEQVLSETEERIKVGQLAEIERAASQASVAQQRENLINARSTLATARLNLLRLMNPRAADFWNRDVTIKSLPEIPKIDLESPDLHVQVAQRLRPDLNQARLRVDSADLTLVQTKNGLLPQLDVFIALGKTGYAQSFFNSAGNIFNEGYNVTVGANYSVPIGNRGARASHQQAQVTRHSVAEAVNNLSLTVEVDVRSACIQLNLYKEQVAATAVTRGYREATLKAETEKFRVGKSTTLLVAQAQRDLLQSQIDEVSALVSYLKAWVNLYLKEGTLLDRRGIECPGSEPVSMPPAKL